jgi:predicted kinase
VKKVYLTKGLPGSGKSTWARQQVQLMPGSVKRVNKDDLRAMLDDGHWSKANEKLVLTIRDQIILASLAAGCNVIVDDTNLVATHEGHIRELVKGIAVVEVVDHFLDVPLETCIANDLKRPNSVGAQVIRRMYRQHVAPKVPPHVFIEGAQDAIICDLDGTLALLGDRNPYDASTCEQDDLNEPVSVILRQMMPRYLSSPTPALILVSGRSSKYREQTVRWLYKHNIIWDFLFMRDEDDNRKDAVIKREIYEDSILGRYNVLFVLDDRDQVVDLWRSLGLTCLQVNYGDF